MDRELTRAQRDVLADQERYALLWSADMPQDRVMSLIQTYARDLTLPQPGDRPNTPAQIREKMVHVAAIALWAVQNMDENYFEPRNLYRMGDRVVGLEGTEHAGRQGTIRSVSYIGETMQYRLEFDGDKASVFVLDTDIHSTVKPLEAANGTTD